MLMECDEVGLTVEGERCEWEIWTYVPVIPDALTNVDTFLQTMQAVNKKMDPQKTLKTMQDFQKENMKMGMTEDMSKDALAHAHACAHTYTQWYGLLSHIVICVCVIHKAHVPVFHCLHLFFSSPFIFSSCHCPVNDTLDDIFDESGDEEESQDIVNQVLDEIGIEITGKVRNSKCKHLSHL